MESMTSVKSSTVLLGQNTHHVSSSFNQDHAIFNRWKFEKAETKHTYIMESLQYNHAKHTTTRTMNELEQRKIKIVKNGDINVNDVNELWNDISIFRNEQYALALQLEELNAYDSNSSEIYTHTDSEDLKNLETTTNALKIKLRNGNLTDKNEIDERNMQTALACNIYKHLCRQPLFSDEENKQLDDTFTNHTIFFDTKDESIENFPQTQLKTLHDDTENKKDEDKDKDET